MPWQVICDFDGTIADVDVTDSLLTRFADPSWQLIEDEWKRGRIGSRECMERQIQLLAALPARIDRHLDGVDIDPHFADFVAFCADSDTPVAVVSDGLDYAIHRILRRYGLGHLPIYANRLEFVAPDRWRLAFPHASGECLAGTCKCGVAARSGQPFDARRQTLLIGDGASDFCFAGQATLVMAKAKLLDHARRKRLPHRSFNNFLEVRKMLADLVGASITSSGSALLA